MRFDAYLLPRLISPKDLQGGTVVVVDVLRATTTIAVALAAGARRVVPALSVQQARRAAARIRGKSVLGGERRCLKIPGFALGNSPSEYVPAAVGSSTVVLTTTNGTKALAHCGKAQRVFLAALVNFGALCRQLASHAHWQVLCAGTRGEVTCEDVLVAGMLWHAWRARHPTADRSQWNDQAELAARLALSACGTALTEYTAALARGDSVVPSTQLAASAKRVLEESAGGRNLTEIGLSADIAVAAQIDSVAIVPVWRAATNEIVAWRPR